jgi:hypothetical protein
MSGIICGRVTRGIAQLTNFKDPKLDFRNPEQAQNSNRTTIETKAAARAFGFSVLGF